MAEHASWQTMPLKRATSINPELLPESTPPDFEFDYVDISSLEAGESGDFSAKAVLFSAAPSRARRVLRSGDSIVSTVRTYLRAVAAFDVVDRPTVASTGFAVLRSNGVLLPRFTYWAVLSESFIGAVVAHSTGVSYPAIAPSVLGDLSITFPPLGVQEAISNHLDREAARIDALIEKKSRFIELLREKRQALVTQAVTKGLDLCVPMKDSGVEWLGQIPAHWKVAALKSLVTTPITDGPHETPDFLDEGVPFVSAEAVSAGVVDFERIRGFISREDHARYSAKYLPRRDDIYMVKSGATTGVTAIVETDLEFNIWSPLAAIRVGRELRAHYLLNFMRSRNFQEGIALNWSFGTQQNIGMGVIGNLRIAVPPLDEQDRALRMLESATARLDALASKSKASIELLRERRSALITAAVTGQIDLREAA